MTVRYDPPITGSVSRCQRPSPSWSTVISGAPTAPTRSSVPNSGSGSSTVGAVYSSSVYRAGNAVVTTADGASSPLLPVHNTLTVIGVSAYAGSKPSVNTVPDSVSSGSPR